MWNSYITEVYIGDESRRYVTHLDFRTRDAYRLFGKRGERSGVGGGDVCRKVLSSWGALWNFFTHTHTHIKGWLQKGGGKETKAQSTMFSRIICKSCESTNEL